MGKTAENKKNDVEIFKRINKLKLKAGAGEDTGAGFIDPKAIKNAQNSIDDKNELYSKEVGTLLKEIDKVWGMVLSDDSDDYITALYHKSNHIKDLAETFDYELMRHFGHSLREFIEKLDTGKRAHQTIVRAHIDAMWVVYHEKISEKDDQKAVELKSMVLKAIEKHS